MVGTDCAVGKKYSALALHRELERRNIKATFRATGQTGIMIAGEGIPIDAVVARRWPDATPTRRTAAGLGRAIAAYFSGRSVTFDVTLDLTGVTEFGQSILEACRRIPYGQTASYSDLARQVGQPLASRAVGSAMANNPLPLIVPCHRVVRRDGSLGGFSSSDGVSMKLRLLRLEGASIALASPHRRAS